MSGGIEDESATMANKIEEDPGRITMVQMVGPAFIVSVFWTESYECILNGCDNRHRQVRIFEKLARLEHNAGTLSCGAVIIR
jgi:hypothetical protein